MAISDRRDEYHSAFHPRKYLEEYGYPDPEGCFTVKFLVKALQVMPTNLFALEFGGGPMLYTVIALAAQAQEIHFSDYVPASLQEVERWLANDPTAFDWTDYTNTVLAIEGHTPTNSMIQQRLAQTRQKITRLISGDALANAPLGPSAPAYDLVTAHYCTDVAAATFEEWVQIMKNISTLVKPGGWLVIGITTGATSNTFVYNGPAVSFDCVDLTPDDIRRGYEIAGFDIKSLYLEPFTLPDNREYSGQINAMACKLRDEPE